MHLIQIGSLHIYQFESFSCRNLVHGIVTRRGGVSRTPWESLNVGGSVGDDPTCVRENTRRVFDAFGRELASKFDVWQIHSADVCVARYPDGDSPPTQADILLTDQPDVTLLMRFADCVPILIYDPTVHAVAMVHAGWQGVVKQAPLAAVHALRKNFGSQAKDLIAGIGPSICMDCYPVGEEVVKRMRAVFGNGAGKYGKYISSQFHLDLWMCCEDQLHRAGVGQIEVSRICTAMNQEDWYSHRAEGGKTGRFAALLALGG